MSADIPDRRRAAIVTRPVPPRPLSAAAGGVCVLLGSIGTVFVPSLLPLWIMLGGIVGGVAYLVAVDRARDVSPPPGLAIARGAARAGAATTASCLVLTGVGSLLGAAGAPVILLLLPAFATWVWRTRPHVHGRSDGGPDAPRAVPPPSSGPALRPDAGRLATHELCGAWQRSYFALIDLPDGPDREDISAWRRSLLDELERRDPVGFGEWLRSGARAGGDPSRYLDLTSDR